MKQIIDKKNTCMMKRMACVMLATFFSLSLMLAVNNSGGLYSKKSTPPSTTTTTAPVGTYGGMLRAGGDGSGTTDDIEGNGGIVNPADYVDGQESAAPIGDGFLFLLVLTAIYGTYKYHKKQLTINN
jgi:hypothetical protein